MQAAVLTKLKTADVYIPVIPKSAPRPRFRGNAYNDPAYKAWKLNFRAFVGEWWVWPPLDHVNVMCVHFYGPQQGDLDNKLKSCKECGNTWRTHERAVWKVGKEWSVTPVVLEGDE